MNTMPTPEKTTTEGTGKENEIYTKRFTETEERARAAAWEVLVHDFLQKYVVPSDTVVDIGAGDGYFVTKIRAARRIAVDLSPHVRALTRHGVEVIEGPATELSSLLDTQADVIFMSNFLEHLPDKRTLLIVLEECRKVMRPGGRLMILQPNIRYVGAAYWDYIDHHIALTEHSLTEALEVSGFSVLELIPRFLPYTAKSTAGRLTGTISSTALVRTYLRFPMLWKLFGQQTFVVGTPVRR